MRDRGRSKELVDRFIRRGTQGERGAGGGGGQVVLQAWEYWGSTMVSSFPSFFLIVVVCYRSSIDHQEARSKKPTILLGVIMLVDY